MVPDQLDQPLVGLGRRDVLGHHLLADEEGDLARAPAHVAEVGVGHLARAVDDAAHDGDLDALQVPGARLDARGGLLQVEERASA